MGTDAALFAFALLIGAAQAQAQTSPIAVAVPDGRLIPGAINTLEIGVAGAINAPTVSSDVGVIRRGNQIATGVWEFSLTVPSAASDLNLNVLVDGRPLGTCR